ncbi:response regulator [Archangium lipolyticum]|uniref:response regulator n=1 Tax=Archangium lipolyticum TaxID=2970465 RepID=UPI00214A6A72|nr:response regulator [Archangium lipolyticum]
MSRILIVEDEEILAASLEDILEDEGHHVRMARNGLEALELLTRERPDLVLLDLMLPLMDGLTVLKTLRRESPAPAVVVMTSCERTVLREVPVQGFLRKPFSLDALLGAVKAALP